MSAILPPPGRGAPADARASVRAHVQASSITRALNIVGDRSALLIAYCLFLGHHRFGEIQQNSGLARSLLSNRLRRLEAQGLLVRRPYQQRPPRHEYRLTAMGRDLYDVALALILWDKRWHYDPACLTHRLVHQDCAAAFTPLLTCHSCHQPVTAREVEWQPGPGFGHDPHPGPTASRRSSLSLEQLAGRHAIMVRCPELLGDRWTAQVIAAAFYRVRHFTDFQQGLGIAPNILHDRLNRLQAMGILRRSDSRTHPEYRLTEAGMDLYPVIVCLMRWGDRWLDDGNGPPLLLQHRACGQRFRPRMVCDQCRGCLAYLNFRAPEVGG